MDSGASRMGWSLVIPLVSAIAAALIAFLSNVYASYITGRNQLALEDQKFQAQLELERQKFQTTLIIEAVKTGQKEKALENLDFFIEAGFLEDDKGEIKRLVQKRNSPVLPAYAEIGKLSRDLGVTERALMAFFQLLEERSVPPEQMGAKLREIVEHYKPLLSQIKSRSISQNPAMEQAIQALEVGDFARAEQILAELEQIQLLEAKRLQDFVKESSLTLASRFRDAAAFHYTKGRYDEAETIYNKALDLVVKNAGTDHPDAVAIRDNLTDIKQKKGSVQEKVLDHGGEP